MDLRYILNPLVGQIFPQQRQVHVNVVDEVIGAEGSRISINFLPEQPDEDFTYAEQTRVLETAQLLTIFMHQVPQVPGNSAAMWIERQDHLMIAPNCSKWKVHNRYEINENLTQELVDGLTRALELLAQSSDQYDYSDFCVNMLILPPENHAAGTKLKNQDNKSAKRPENQGLAVDMYSSPKLENACGWYCLAQALSHSEKMRELWRGGTDWLPIRPNHPNQYLTGRDKVNSARKIINDLKASMGFTPDLWQIKPVEGTGTIQQLVKLQPQLKIVIYDSVSSCVYDYAEGLEWEPDTECTIYLCHITDYIHRTGHLRYINRIHQFRNLTLKAPSYFCEKCLQRHNSPASYCAEEPCKCLKCGEIFDNPQDLAIHKETEDYSHNIQCEKCLNTFYNTNCLESHRCRRSDLNLCKDCGKIKRAGHICHEYKCQACRDWVPPGTNHICYMKKPHHKTIHEVTGLPADSGKYIYAFDFEAMAKARIADGMNEHTVNLICVKQCYTNNRWAFKTLMEFFQFMFSIPEQCTFLAHNFKGYDGRLMYEELMLYSHTIGKFLLRGSKILRMEVGKLTFGDSMLLFPGSLQSCAKTFGLDQDGLEKLEFPHKFNRPENQSYRGEIPGLDEWDLDGKTVGARKQLLKEIEEFKKSGKEWNFQEQMLKYCYQDVEVLAKSIEAFRDAFLQKNPLDPVQYITIASVAMTTYRQYYMPENTIGVLSQDHHTLIQPSMHGGRTNTCRLLKEMSPQELRNDIYMKYVDVQSLYPFVQYFKPLPIGLPRHTEFGAGQFPANLASFFGFIICDIHPTRELHHPVLVNYDDEKQILNGDLLPQTKVTITSVEFHKAREYGYECTRVYDLIEFESSTELFKTYFQTFLKDKIEASGVPAHIKTDEQWIEYAEHILNTLNIKLERERMVKNPSRKTVSKLSLNSLWGKFAETMRGTNTKYIKLATDKSEYLASMRKWSDGKIVLTHHHYSGNQDSIVLSWHDSSPDLSSSRRSRINIAIASFVTAHARMVLWEQLNKLGKRAYYHDTDSIIYLHEPGKYNIPEGCHLGDWEDETPGKRIIKYASTGPKSYCYVVLNEDGTTTEFVKSKGVSKNSFNDKVLVFETFKKLILKQIKDTKTKQVVFKYKRGYATHTGTMATGIKFKLVNVTFNKGVIDPIETTVYPFGVERFRRDLVHCRQWAETPKETLWAGYLENRRRLGYPVDDASSLGIPTHSTDISVCIDTNDAASV